MTEQPPLPQPSEDVRTISARLRLTEERYSELRKNMTVIEQNMLAHQKKSVNDLKNLGGDLLKLKRQILEVEDRILAVIKEIKLTAKREDVDVLKKYIELWNPVKFATMDNVEHLIDEKLTHQSQEEENEK